jgi:hypothetical protein
LIIFAALRGMLSSVTPSFRRSVYSNYITYHITVQPQTVRSSDA